jgi:hypothetical protein
MIDINQIIELVGVIETQDPIDWGMLNISEDEAVKLIALDVIEMFNKQDGPDRELIMLSTITKLVLENFVLNLQLQKIRRGS